MEVNTLIKTVLKIHRAEVEAVRVPLRKEIDQQFESRIGPLRRPRGIPTREKIRQRYTAHPIHGIFNLVDRYDFQTWTLRAMSESFLSEQQLLEYALTIPDGLRYILEAVSDLGIMETLRRMRNSFGCTVLFVETPILFSLQETDHDIPLTYSYPPRKELGMRGIWAFFLMYFRRSTLSTHVRVYWVGLRPPPSTIYLKIHLPTWIEVGEIAVIPTTPIGILQLQLLRYIPPRPCRCRLCRIRKMSATRQQRFFDKWGWSW